MMKNTPKQIYITKSYHTTYMGDSLREAQDIFTKTRGSCRLFKLDGGMQVLMQSKIKDAFPNIMKDAFENAAIRL